MGNYVHSHVTYRHRRLPTALITTIRRQLALAVRAVATSQLLQSAERRYTRVVYNTFSNTPHHHTAPPLSLNRLIKRGCHHRASSQLSFSPSRLPSSRPPVTAAPLRHHHRNYGASAESYAPGCRARVCREPVQHVFHVRHGAV